MDDGDDFGWPYCYYSVTYDKKVLAPEYGGDGRKVGRCAAAKNPVIAFPGHWAPLALAFHSGDGLGAGYSDGLFVAFHGSWNRAPMPQAGYRVVFAPFTDGKATGKYVTFASGPNATDAPRQRARGGGGRLALPGGGCEREDLEDQSEAVAGGSRYFPSCRSTSRRSASISIGRFAPEGGGSVSRWYWSSVPGSLRTWPVSTATTRCSGRDRALRRPGSARRPRSPRSPARSRRRRRPPRPSPPGWLVVVHRQHHAVGLPDRAHRAIVRGGVADPDGGGHRLRLHACGARANPSAKLRANGAAPAACTAARRGRRVISPHALRLAQRLPERGGVAQVAGRQHDPVRRIPAELLQHLEHDRLLPLEAERVDRVEQVDAELARSPPRPAGGSRRSRRAPAGSARRRRATAPACPARRCPPARAPARGSRPAPRRPRARPTCCRWRRRRPPRAPMRQRLRHADRHAAILERAGRVVPLVLEQQPRQPGPAVERLAVEQRRVALRVRHHVARRDGSTTSRKRQTPEAGASGPRPRRSVKRSISSSRVRRAARCCTSSSPPHTGQRGAGSISGSSLPQATQACQVGGRSVRNFMARLRVDSISRAPRGPPRPPATRLGGPPAA